MGGPLLFLIMIGDIDKSVLTAFLSSFADDTRVGHWVKTKEDLQNFQKDLDNIYEWTSKNNMEFNSSKFECLRYGEGGFPDVMQLDDRGEPIEAKSHVKDLGVYVSDDCTFGFHIRNVAVESRNLCSWILRVFQTREEAPMKTVYVSCQTKSGVWVSGVESGKKERNSRAGDGAETVHQKNRRYRAPHIPGAIEETKIIFTGKKKREIFNNISLENVRG